MNDQLTKQADDIRLHFEKSGWFSSSTPLDASNLIEATIPSDRNQWLATVKASPGILTVYLLKDGKQVYENPLNPVQPAGEIVARLNHVIAFSVVNDPDATNEEIQKAVLLVREVTPHGKVGYMGDYTTIAVLAEAILRLTDRIKELETGT